MLLWPLSLPLHPPPQSHSPSSFPLHTPSSFPHLLLRILYLYPSGSFTSIKGQLKHLPSLVSSRLPSVKGVKFSLPTSFYLSFSLVFLYCFGHGLKLCYLLSFIALLPVFPQGNVFQRWTSLLIAPHCLDPCRICDRHSWVQGWSVHAVEPLTCPCLHESFLAGWNSLCTSRIFVQKSIDSEFFKEVL